MGAESAPQKNVEKCVDLYIYFFDLFKGQCARNTVNYISKRCFLHGRAPHIFPKKQKKTIQQIIGKSLKNGVPSPSRNASKNKCTKNDEKTRKSKKMRVWGGGEKVKKTSFFSSWDRFGCPGPPKMAPGCLPGPLFPDFECPGVPPGSHFS